MRCLVTGATGFLGGRLVRLLRQRGDEVVALVRRPEAGPARALRTLGIEVARGDVTDAATVRAAAARCEAVYHLAAWYELGVDDAARMGAINVGGTRHVLEAAAEGGAALVVHCSSVAALGPTGGAAAAEDHVRTSPFGSLYERTKHEAHAVARGLAARGAPVRVVLPGTIFGPGDRSLIARVLRAHLAGVLIAWARRELPMSWVYVDDCARGILDAAARGVPGGEYILVGDVVPSGAWIDRVADITGIRAPRVQVPEIALRAGASLFPAIAPALGLPRGTARDALAMAGGGAWAFSSTRARDELGWTSTDLDVALARTLIAFDHGGGWRFRPRSQRARRALDAARSTPS